MTHNSINEEYRARINCVIDYIEQNLTNNFTLEELAMVANFSKFHFHRIFNAFIGETLFNFIQRIRVEKAAALLKCLPQKQITEIAYDCGFSSSAAFARCFKEHFHMSATAWKKKTTEMYKQNNHSFLYKNPLPHLPEATRVEYKNNEQIWNIPLENKKRVVIVKNLPSMNVAYIRYIGPYKGDTKLFEKLFNTLFKWAGSRDLLNFPTTQVLSIYHDTINITDENKLRTSVCITVPDKTKAEGKIGCMKIPGGKYAMARFNLSASQYSKAWSWVYGSWLPESGYQPDDRPCFELYPAEENECDNKKTTTTVDICIPVKPL